MCAIKSFFFPSKLGLFSFSVLLQYPKRKDDVSSQKNLSERPDLIPVRHNDKLDPSEGLVGVELESVRLYFSDARGTLCDEDDDVDDDEDEDDDEGLVAVELESVRLYFSDARGTLCSHSLVKVTMSTELLQFCHWRNPQELVCLIYSEGFSAAPNRQLQQLALCYLFWAKLYCQRKEKIEDSGPKVLTQN